MKKSRFTEAQIMGGLRLAEGGMPVADLCRAHGISSASFYKWRARYGGMDALMMSQMRALEDENRRLKPCSLTVVQFWAMCLPFFSPRRLRSNQTLATSRNGVSDLCGYPTGAAEAST